MHVSIKATSRNDLSAWPWTPGINPILNEDYSFDDVRRLVSRRLNSYDAELSFTGYPKKTLLPEGSLLVRLDTPLVLVTGVFMKPWWMTSEESRRILSRADTEGISLRFAWQQLQAMPKLSKGLRTLMVEIVLTAPAYAWIGTASSLFNKGGGAEQVYLPNLAHGSGPYRSDHARLLRTATLPA